MNKLPKKERLRLEEVILKTVDDFAIGYRKKEQLRSMNHFRVMALYKYRTIIQMVLENNPKRVVDLGCGNNIMIRSLQAFRPDIECWALDVRAVDLSFGQSKNSGVNFAAADIINGVPLKPGFDVVVSTDVIEHLDTPKSLVKEGTRLLSPGGRFIISTPHKGSIPYYFLKMIRKDIRDKWVAGEEHLHPEFCVQGKLDDPERHRVEGFTKKELAELGKMEGLAFLYGLTHGLPFTGAKFYERLSPGFLKILVDAHDKMFLLPGLVAVLRK